VFATIAGESIGAETGERAVVSLANAAVGTGVVRAGIARRFAFE